MTEAVLDKDTQIQELSTEQALEQAGIQELAIIVVARDLNPSLFTPDFLVQTGLIPADWALVRQPVVSQQLAQIVFQNGISLVAQPGKVTFSESIGVKSDEELMVANLAAKYVEIMANADYLAIGINPQKVVAFTEQPQDVHTYITHTLFQPGYWQELGNQPMQASCNLLYQLNECRFQLSLNPTELQLPSDVQLPGLLFAGNFHYQLTDADVEARKQQIQGAIASWRNHLHTFRSLIAERFLSLL